MDYNEVYSEVVDIVANQLGIEPSDIAKEDTLGRDLGAYGDDMLYMEIDIEESLGIDFDFAEMTGTTYASAGEITIEALVNYIAEKYYDRED